MVNLDEIKQKLGETTEKLETQVGGYYFVPEPWQRGLILLGIGLGTIAIIYLLTGNKDNNKEQLEAQAEERLIRRMGVLKKLRE